MRPQKPETFTVAGVARQRFLPAISAGQRPEKCSLSPALMHIHMSVAGIDHRSTVAAD